MNKLTIFFLSIILFQACKKPGCFESAGPQVSMERQISSFNRIELYDNVDLTLTQDSVESIVVVAPKNIEPNISVRVENGVLTIRNNTDCKWLRKASEKCEVQVHVKTLEHLNYNGSGNVTSTNAIAGERIKFYSTTGAGNIDVTLNVQELFANVQEENADFTFHGKADFCLCYSNPRGSFNISDLTVGHLIIDYAGLTDITVNATDILDARIYHTGNVYYKGHPPTILTAFYSSGRLYPAP